MDLQYNTSKEKLRLPQYGRLVQDMIDHAKLLENRSERSAYAERIVRVMALLNPQMCTTPNCQQTFWNHLAYMADYALDVDYPCEIDRNSVKTPPHKLSYPGNKIRYRHYGHIIEQIMEMLKAMPADTPARDELIRLVALRMKRYLADWKGDGIEDEKVGHDMAMYTQGAVTPEQVVHLLEESEGRMSMPTATGFRYNGRHRR